MLTSDDLELLSRTTLVVVADSIVLQPAQIHFLSKEMDRTELRHVQELVDAIRPRVRDVIVYDSPSAFIDSISKHVHDLVLPDWSGTGSWNRFGLVPAICESYGLDYIGGDAYTKIVCQDKFLAKSLCGHAGISTPFALYVDKPSKLDSLNLCRFPVVVKPCFEGSSVGIGANSIATSKLDAHARATELLQVLNGPVLVEEFCPGREVSICVLGNAAGISRIEVGERYIPGNETYFDSHLFSFDLKKNSKKTALRNVTGEMPEEYLSQSKRLFQSLTKVELIRVDGRLKDGRFYVVELTPDTHLGARAEFCGTFIQAGLTYTEILSELALNALTCPRRQAANKQTSADNN